MIRRLLAVAAMAVACVAHAQDYPSKPIRIIIPSTPGGGTDYIGRLMGNKLHELNGWSVVPENKPGAGTALGLAEAARAPAQGYDLVIGQSDNVTLIPLLMKVAYDPVKDLVPVALVATTPMVLLVSDSSPYKTLPEVIEAARKAPNTLSYGTSGTGGGVHIAMEMLQHEAGFKMQHVPYKGSAPALADLMGGHLQFAGSSISSAASLIKAGKVRALAVTSPKRNPALPDVPTVAELGYKDFSVVTYYGVLAPSKTPAAVVARLNADFNKLLARPDVRDALAAQGLEADPVSSEQFAALIRSDIGKARQTIATAGIVVQQ
ncbi:tripartite tricarboxylate transporter substrate binding protein [Achromobacter ruhlandii]|uniref:Bug family tripartite tricarboxylate transporter substrate binding protein n=1 Tax=Achromobacter ruhlandii TaxID=72557 RepID=UPI0021F1731E|nr:tripartite tricarboxylate transporter substrate binding protein [Achromobacter ruhlandii]MCV6794982.1 tripartite tricarboxylate transporter substrate binding protein [Achromobacter ruhlandii]MCV6802555.1 tripartite tricarboxylate transporter substrate binding protein [Achromobacter ruhlandii]MCV6811630.1 tripartite tricarboxylate transporter substrate binding protein [Achromobacter ruhlandii]MCV6821757.1 tripartite tricarboxylate transporter substrate binding protein [Achromobacter ruhlandii